ncbi:hypothetical protein HY642_04450 [Candidatus Woesearchaeota archaeon]|nr:hypothetical protein [Candidatus Woesearchaeota archaeon]
MTIDISWEQWSAAEKNGNLAETLGAMAGITPVLYNPAKALPAAEKLQASFAEIYSRLNKPIAVGNFVDTQGTHELAIMPVGLTREHLDDDGRAYLSFAEFASRYAQLHAQKQTLEECVINLEQGKAIAEQKLGEIGATLEDTAAMLKAPGKNCVSKTQLEKDLNTCTRRKEHFTQDLEKCTSQLEQARQQANAAFEDAGLRAAFATALRSAEQSSRQFYYELLDYGTAAGIAEDKSLPAPGISGEVLATITASCQPKTFTYSIKFPERDTTRVIPRAKRSFRKLGIAVLAGALGIGALAGTWFAASRAENKRVLSEMAAKPRLDLDTCVWWMSYRMEPGVFMDATSMREKYAQVPDVLKGMAVRLDGAELFSTEADALAGKNPVHDQKLGGAYRVELTAMAEGARKEYVVPWALLEEYHAVCLDINSQRLPVRIQRAFRVDTNKPLTEVMIAMPVPKTIAKLANWKQSIADYTHVGFIFGSDRGPLGETIYAASSERLNYDIAPTCTFDIEPGEVARVTAYALNKEGSIAKSRKKLLLSAEMTAPETSNAAERLPLIEPIQH